jgi:hypothetical protein
MTPKAFIAFSAVTAVIIAAAGFVVVERYATATFVKEKEPIFPAMHDKVNEVTELLYEDKQVRIKVARQPDGQFVLAERHNYPVSNEIVRELVIGLAELKVLEPKTKLEKLYPRIQVDDLEKENSLAKHLQVKGKNGEMLIDALIGRRNFDTTGLTDEGRYVRRVGEAQSWLVAGRFDIPDQIKKWVGKEFMNVDAKRIDTSTTSHPDGTQLIVQRQDKSGTRFKVLNVPEGREVEYQIDVDNISDGVDRIEFEDVAKPGEHGIDFPKDKTIRTTYKTYDGLIVEADVYAKDESKSEFWGRFKASVADSAENKDEVQKEADKINAEVTNWVYRIPAFKYRYMSRRLDEVLKKEDS